MLLVRFLSEEIPKGAGAAFAYDAQRHYYSGPVERKEKLKKMKKKIDKLSGKNRVLRRK